MKIDWNPGSPNKQGWYLIKRSEHPVVMAFWFSNDHWSLCAEPGMCRAKDVIGWVEIE